MNTAELLVSKLQRQLSYHEYVRTSDWWLRHIDSIATKYPFLKIGAEIKAEIGGELRECTVKGFIINNSFSASGILVETEYGNVFYYETKKR